MPPAPLPRLAAPLAALSLLAAACGEGRSSSGQGPSGQAPAPASSALTGAGPAASASAAAPAGPDAARGAELVKQFECARCHDGLPGAAPPVLLTSEGRPDSKHCFHCHQAIRDGLFKAPKAEVTQRWKKNVELLCDVPSLTGAAKRLRRGWVEAFLLRPVDLRPRLGPTMPRLSLSPEQARDMAAFLVPDAPATELETAPRGGGPVDPRAKELFAKATCNTCHAFSGVLPPPAKPAGGLSSAQRLAPDLRHARERMTLKGVMEQLRDPRSNKPDALMPQLPLNESDIEALARFVMTAPLGDVEAPPAPERLPVLARRVSYDEVKRRVFNKVCWHCHSDADYAIGDGGPGNTGGFGFKPRGLNLGAYEGIASGSLDDQGERRSVFAAMGDGTPRLLASLLSRQVEEAGGKEGELRGMPLGLPALSPEEIQLVESWIAQGHLPD